MGFPHVRMRRLRANQALRDMFRETPLDKGDLIAPLFVVEGKSIKKPISSLPGQFQFSIDKLIGEVKELKALGIPAIMLFGIPKKKDELGTGAYAAGGIIQRAVSAIKKNVKGILVITDVCLCEYTSHGHCGVVKRRAEEFEVDNDASLVLLARTAVSQAKAGADMVAPSDMMDGRVKAIREALDKNNFKNIPIISYAVKHASSLYSPFRQAAESAPAFGDRRSYQLDPGNFSEAMREVQSDIEEGADVIMIKPALTNLDVIAKVKERFNVPVAAYNVSGEYAIVKAGAKAGFIDEEKVANEILLSIKRSGADVIVTYFAKQFAAKKR